MSSIPPSGGGDGPNWFLSFQKASDTQGSSISDQSLAKQGKRQVPSLIEPVDRDGVVIAFSPSVQMSMNLKNYGVDDLVVLSLVETDELPEEELHKLDALIGQAGDVQLIPEIARNWAMEILSRYNDPIVLAHLSMMNVNLRLMVEDILRKEERLKQKRAA